MNIENTESFSNFWKKGLECNQAPKTPLTKRRRAQNGMFLSWLSGGVRRSLDHKFRKLCKVRVEWK